MDLKDGVSPHEAHKAFTLVASHLVVELLMPLQTPLGHSCCSQQAKEEDEEEACLPANASVTGGAPRDRRGFRFLLPPVTTWNQGKKSHQQVNKRRKKNKKHRLATPSIGGGAHRCTWRSQLAP